MLISWLYERYSFTDATMILLAALIFLGTMATMIIFLWPEIRIRLAVRVYRLLVLLDSKIQRDPDDNALPEDAEWIDYDLAEKTKIRPYERRM